MCTPCGTVHHVATANFDGVGVEAFVITCMGARRVSCWHTMGNIRKKRHVSGMLSSLSSSPSCLRHPPLSRVLPSAQRRSTRSPETGRGAREHSRAPTSTCERVPSKGSFTGAHPSYSFIGRMIHI
ncbi:hypothetical protein BD414DRAFT_488955 [Trametes punicea]|nr:hypothetical protein BD414DRAFT_488955 [Trametes punicea]